MLTMKFLNKTLLGVIVLFISFSTSYAQPRGGGGGGGGGRSGGGPEEMLKREKQELYKQVTDLSDDQTALIDGIYTEFGETLKENFEEMRQNNDREGMREKMDALNKEKDGLIADVLNEEQYAVYNTIIAKRGKRGKRGGDTEEE